MCPQQEWPYLHSKRVIRARKLEVNKKREEKSKKEREKKKRWSKMHNRWEGVTRHHSMSQVTLIWCVYILQIWFLKSRWKAKWSKTRSINPPPGGGDKVLNPPSPRSPAAVQYRRVTRWLQRAGRGSNEGPERDLSAHPRGCWFNKPNGWFTASTLILNIFNIFQQFDKTC